MTASLGSLWIDALGLILVKVQQVVYSKLDHRGRIAGPGTTDLPLMELRSNYFKLLSCLENVLQSSAGLIVHRYADNYVAQSKKKKQKVKKSNRRIVIHTVLAVRWKMSCYITGVRGGPACVLGGF